MMTSAKPADTDLVKAVRDAVTDLNMALRAAGKWGLIVRLIHREDRGEIELVRAERRFV